MWLVTAAGRKAWKTQDIAIPDQYRSLLRSIDTEGETRAIQELLGQYPEKLVHDWLHELQELGFLESQAASPQTSKAAAEAAAVLADTGAYLADRTGKPRNRKAAAETTILIVEDDPDQLALADLRVSTAGYKVRAVGSVSELTRVLAQDELPDLLLLDVMLPDGNGFDVLSELRRNPRLASLPIILLTVISETDYVAHGLALGADGYITKPYSKNILIGVIKGALGDPA
jgi:CheY-like chemotaxis protein